MIFKILRFTLYGIFRSTKPRLTILILITAIIFSTRAAHAFSLGGGWQREAEFCAAACYVFTFFPFILIGEKISDQFEKNDTSILIVDTENETVVENKVIMGGGH